MFTVKKHDSHSAVKSVTFGPEDHRLSFGGESVCPFYYFDRELPNRPLAGIEILDTDPDFLEKCRQYDQLASADFICLHLEGGDPNGENKSPEELSAQVGRASEEIRNKPIAVAGCDHVEKDALILPACAKVLGERNPLILSAKEENLSHFSAAGTYVLGCESSVDINLAKQLNVLAVQAGMPAERIVMNAGNAACGYGFEYLVSTMERIRAAALSQDDKMLQMPILTLLGNDAWNTKEALAEEADMPGWGDRKERGRKMEIMSAAAVLAAGADAVVLRDPASADTISKMIRLLTD